MEVIGNGRQLPDGLRGGALAIGNFDGVHLGHQAVIRLARRGRRDGPLLVATFEPHPARVFQPDAPPFMLTTTAQRMDILAAIGVDAAIVIPFDRNVASMSAEAFAQVWLKERIGASHVVTGENFTFGHRRSGNVGTLRELGEKLGFTTDFLPAVVGEDGEEISSSAIRLHVRKGRVREAARLLSRPFAIRGTVSHGAKLGRTIGVPTANLTLGDYLRPRYGVYATRIHMPDGSIRGSVTNIGVRPMFEPPIELLETSIFDWSGDIYGQTVSVELIDFLRPELKLADLDALKKQIARDTDLARKILGDG